MKLSLTKSKSLILLGIIILGASLRFYKINQVPHGLYWDEAAITYNAWSIAEWNRDEHGIKLPLSFKSYGDYKAPLLIYILGLTYKLTGLQISYLRIFIAICGVINILLIYGISQKLKPKDKLFIITSTVLMAITPWAIHFSRIGVEAQLALTLILLGTYITLKAQESWKWLFMASACFALSIYAYHSAKIFVPLFILFTAIFIKRSSIRPSKPSLITAFIVFALLITPFLHDNIVGSGFERGKSLIIFSNGKIAPTTQIAKELFNNIASYLSPNYWVQNIDSVGLRHGVPGHGTLFISAAILVILGIIYSLKSSNSRQHFLVVWLILGIAPAILSHENPHAIRSMMALPAAVMLAGSAVSWIYQKLTIKSKTNGVTFLCVIATVFAIELAGYANAYYGIYARESATEFQYGYQEAILTAQGLSRANDKIIVTSMYGQPYIYTLLYRHLTPEEFKFGALANYEFHEIDWPNAQTDRIYIATPEEIPPTDPAVIHIINIPQTKRAVFVIAKN